jgi:hypothetical protein
VIFTAGTGASELLFSLLPRAAKRPWGTEVA